MYIIIEDGHWNPGPDTRARVWPWPLIRSFSGSIVIVSPITLFFFPQDQSVCLSHYRFISHHSSSFLIFFVITFHILKRSPGVLVE